VSKDYFPFWRLSTKLTHKSQDRAQEKVKKKKINKFIGLRKRKFPKERKVEKLTSRSGNFSPEKMN